MIRDKIISCVPTALVNLNAVAVSMMDIESVFRMLSYLVAIIWTSMKIYELAQTFKKNNKMGKKKKKY